MRKEESIKDYAIMRFGAGYHSRRIGFDRVWPADEGCHVVRETRRRHVLYGV